MIKIARTICTSYTRGRGTEKPRIPVFHGAKIEKKTLMKIQQKFAFPKLV